MAIVDIDNEYEPGDNINERFGRPNGGGTQ